MKKESSELSLWFIGPISVLMVLVFFAVIFFIFRPASIIPESFKNQSENLSFNDEEMGLFFSYSNKYLLREIYEGELEEDLIRAFYLINKKEYDELKNSTEPREGPPVINISIFRNPRDLSASDWVRLEPSLSNIVLIVGEVLSDTISNLPAVRYKTDGLYQANNVVISVNKLIFMFSGSFIDRNSEIYIDYYKLIESLKIEQKIQYIPEENVGEFPDM